MRSLDVVVVASNGGLDGDIDMLPFVRSTLQDHIEEIEFALLGFYKTCREFVAFIAGDGTNANHVLAADEGPGLCHDLSFEISVLHVIEIVLDLIKTVLDSVETVLYPIHWISEGCELDIRSSRAASSSNTLSVFSPMVAI